MNVSTPQTPTALQKPFPTNTPLPTQVTRPVVLTHRIAMWLGIRLILWSTRASDSHRAERAAIDRRRQLHIESARAEHLLRVIQVPRQF